MNNNFEKIKFGDDYLKWGKELVINLNRIGLNGWEHFGNDTFEIVPFNFDEENEYNFKHIPTGVCVEWYKHVDRFESVNKKINYEDWQEIIQDCVKSVLGDNYIEPVKEIKLNCNINFGEHYITENEFQEKFNKFIKENEWNI